MQEQITKIAQDLHEVLKRFPEFEAVSLAMITVAHYDDQGGSITSREPSLVARRPGGEDWLTYEESEEVYSMHNLIDWGQPTRSLLSGLGLRGSSLVFTQDECTADAIAQKLSERLERRSSSTLSAGM